MKSKKDLKRIIIWALYDDAESSYKNAIQKYFQDENVEVHSMGINDVHLTKSDKFFYHRIDLSLNNSNLIKELKEKEKKYGKPDIILASPPCESWSCADCGGRMFRKIDKKGNWVVMNYEYYKKYNENCHPVKLRSFIQKERSRLVGESTLGGGYWSYLLLSTKSMSDWKSTDF